MKRSAVKLTNVMCADDSCRYNKRHKCRKDKIDVNYHGRRTVNGFEEFRACADYEESKRTKEFIKFMEGVKADEGVHSGDR